ncbi:unnamed protein product [Hermetia illucens]|uniref:Uncharacterized protein n=1 Tax=Hermetia illucens TaxID=343691 RepID=A0A7R8Z0N0_HERIL|nr:unnamed protein product [Hermetia illucens]
MQVFSGLEQLLSKGGSDETGTAFLILEKPNYAIPKNKTVRQEIIIDIETAIKYEKEKDEIQKPIARILEKAAERKAKISTN